MKQDSESQKTTLNPSYVGERVELLDKIPTEAKSILDLGCATGSLGTAIKHHNPHAKVTGVEYDQGMASIAQTVLDDVRVLDLNQTRLIDHFSNGTFDAIIMGDILEHLMDPWSVLKDAASMLSKDGVIITSIPNVRHISTFTSLFFKGEWPLNSRGIHDKTHLRWFTIKNIRKMFAEAKVVSIQEQRNMRILEGVTLVCRIVNKFAKIFDLPILRGFFTFQYIHVVKKL